MCSITYLRDPKSVNMKDYLKFVKWRWTDSIWVISNKEIKKYTDKFSNFYKKVPTNWPVAIHLRKASVWKNDLSNAHPYWKDKEDKYSYTLMHNGTMKDILSFLEIEVQREYHKSIKDWSDTKLFHKYISNKFSTLEEIKKELDYLKQFTDIGIMFVVDKDWRCLFYSDGERVCHIDIINNKVNSIMNYNYEKRKKTTDVVDWYMIFDFNTWKVLDKDYIERKDEFVETINTDLHKYTMKIYNNNLGVKEYMSPQEEDLVFEYLTKHKNKRSGELISNVSSRYDIKHSQARGLFVEWIFFEEDIPEHHLEYYDKNNFLFSNYRY